MSSSTWAFRKLVGTHRHPGKSLHVREPEVTGGGRSSLVTRAALHPRLLSCGLDLGDRRGQGVDGSPRVLHDPGSVNGGTENPGHRDDQIRAQLEAGPVDRRVQLLPELHERSVCGIPVRNHRADLQLEVDAHHDPALGRTADLGEPCALEGASSADVDLVQMISLPGSAIIG